ncbi:hypothetical protein MAPG_05930 [Magnaporthiopsis poae ATCC 64411]|uniref:Uncharacterized protein n=1 Tax=Magnaporthiopsis poae (strain ATCC 64411 / 73-15) TaxID=644358 RepID=A0A0C4E0P8_MAGP6|nr:hypothetical protein MAPG_05930 [Magnaporthiopsis poae ATCC 64411]
MHALHRGRAEEEKGLAARASAQKWEIWAAIAGGANRVQQEKGRRNEWMRLNSFHAASLNCHGSRARTARIEASGQDWQGGGRLRRDDGGLETGLGFSRASQDRDDPDLAPDSQPN